jgi:AraC-like DNA-binding protein
MHTQASTISSMDSIAGLLDGPRAREAFLLRSRLSAPWSMRVEDEAPLTLLAVARGSAWVVPGDGAPVAVGEGGVVVLRGPDHYTVADDPATAPQIVIKPGQICETPTGEPVRMADLGVRTWGNASDGPTELLTGVYQLRSEISRRLLAALPAVLSLEGWRNPLVDYLAQEIVKDEPGQEAVLDRLLDVLLIAALREWFARPAGQAPGWYAAHSDPVVGPALKLMQAHVARPWTVASLAAATGVSRAALARRFKDLVGEPPMAFLAGWRLTLAADLLREPGATVASVARQVGYGTPFALSTAFKRQHGLSPAEHRARAEPVIHVTPA